MLLNSFFKNKCKKLNFINKKALGKGFIANEDVVNA